MNLRIQTTYLNGSEQYKYYINEFCMHVFLCWECMCVCCYFSVSIPVCLPSFAAQQTTLCLCCQYWERYDFLGTQYRATILQLNALKVYKYIERNTKKTHLFSSRSFCQLEMWMFYTSCLSLVCFKMSMLIMSLNLHCIFNTN